MSLEEPGREKPTDDDDAPTIECWLEGDELVFSERDNVGGWIAIDEDQAQIVGLERDDQ